MYGTFKEYHTSLDNLDFVTEQALNESKKMYLKVIDSLEKNLKYERNNPYCEPQMSKYGLYPNVGGKTRHSKTIERQMWILNYADGKQNLCDIANLSDDSLIDLIPIAEELVNAGLIRELE